MNTPAITTNLPLTAIVKPTYACNLGCLYCYEGGRSQPYTEMSLDTLRNVITKLAQYHGTEFVAHIIWHGGEPLLMGLDFFRSIVQIENELGPDFRFDNSVQTNGTLLNEEMLDFFTEHSFSIGTSLDGPQWLHDFTRPYLDGHSSYHDVLKTLGRMRERSERPPYRQLGGGVIAVLSRPTLAHLDEFYDFFRDNSIRVKINPIFYVGSGAAVRDKLGIMPREYGEAMVHLFDRWYYDRKSAVDIDPVGIDPFDLILGNLITGQPHGCQFGPACYDSFIAIGPNGDVYPCGRWSNTEPFCLGNLNYQNLQEVCLSPLLEKFRRGRQEAKQSCLPCEFLAICNSGCIENSFLIRQRLNDRDYYCSGYKVLFKHLKDALIKSIEKAVVEVDNIATDEHTYIRILDKDVDLQKLDNPILIRVIEQRIFGKGSQPENYNECKETTYYDHKRHKKYKEYKKHKKHRRYERYKRYERNWRDSKHRDYSDHSDNWTMC